MSLNVGRQLRAVGQQEGRRQHEICAATVEYLKCLARHFDKAVAGVEGPDQTIPAQRDLPLQHGYQACPAVAVLRRLGAGSEIKGLLNEAVGAAEYGRAQGEGEQRLIRERRRGLPRYRGRWFATVGHYECDHHGRLARACVDRLKRHVYRLPQAS